MCYDKYNVTQTHDDKKDKHDARTMMTMMMKTTWWSFDDNDDD